MLHLKPILVPEWPKLAWVACLTEDEQEIQVLHGPMVEVAEEWIAEAVWAAAMVGETWPLLSPELMHGGV